MENKWNELGANDFRSSTTRRSRKFKIRMLTSNLNPTTMLREMMIRRVSHYSEIVSLLSRSCT